MGTYGGRSSVELSVLFPDLPEAKGITSIIAPSPLYRGSWRCAVWRILVIRRLGGHSWSRDQSKAGQPWRAPLELARVLVRTLGWTTFPAISLRLQRNAGPWARAPHAQSQAKKNGSMRFSQGMQDVAASRRDAGAMSATQIYQMHQLPLDQRLDSRAIEVGEIRRCVSDQHECGHFMWCQHRCLRRPLRTGSADPSALVCYALRHSFNDQSAESSR